MKGFVLSISVLALTALRNAAADPVKKSDTVTEDSESEQHTGARPVRKSDMGMEDSVEHHVPMWTKVGFIGAGNMAQAVATSLIRTGLCIPAQIIASAPSERFKLHWPEPMDFALNDNHRIIKEAEYVFLAMKPQYLDSAIQGLVNDKVTLNSSRCIISMLVGVDLETLKKKLSVLVPNPNDAPTIIRVMPNTAMKYGKGITGMCHDVHLDKESEHLNMAIKIMEQGGIVEIIPESMMNSFGAIAGSGCAYLFLVMDAMADGAVKQGIPRDMALRIGAQLLKGSGQLVHKDLLRMDHAAQAHPAVIKDQICSPGGSTIAGIHALEKAGVRCAFIDAIEAAKKRSDEIGQAAKNK
ncbi:uncharacterized protein LOC103505866 isoform X2 [Diaphorina citri]|uniref:Pyrroline-5-carboxylate reductase n=3 Tax=Diaphorina citri TaxID=121845 RepID=A0A1S3CV63_DIACI|nr:uncharacterized protein LOC103505866 isoform X1 [Diaphorina citri]XP_026676889.1 uncharacterized protein LOC103505866 isoform X2 [Diaphorina citri]KAI5710624.1 hypothetical protein M8J75_010241 [Diaphorina citri]KAI5744762.1 hypothetical protein M8J76_004975 [Diaphorina citri]